MNKQINLLKELEIQKKRFKKLEEKMIADLEELPEGYLMKRGDGRLFKVFSRNGKKEQIKLNQNDKTIISNLKYRKYIKEALPVLRMWIKCIDEFLHNVVVYDPVTIEKRLKEQYRGLSGLPIFLDGDINPEEWHAEPQQKMYKDGLIHPSERGLMTRSKSEAQIASRYERMEWKFEYEPVVTLNDGRILRPDFGILHPYKRKIIYHEHFGMMDDPEYAMKALKKLDDYASVGICLGDNLVITLETKHNPLTYQAIDELIQKIEEM